MSKGGSSTQTIQKADPWSGVKPSLQNLYGKVDQGLNNIQDYYPGQTFANLTPLQEAGMFGNLDYAQNMFAPATAGFQRQLGQYMDAPTNITNDPAVQNMMQANQNSVTDWLQQQALPSIRSGASRAGQYGSSRQGIAEGLAINKGAQTLADANAKTALGAYGTAAGLAGNAMANFPGALEMGLRPGDIAIKYGNVYQSLADKALQEQMQRYAYPEETYWNRIGQAAGALQGYPSGSSSTATGPGESMIPNLLGAASLAKGAGLFGAAAPAASAWTAPLAATGLGIGGATIAASLPAAAAALPAVAGPSTATYLAALAASDVRLKENIVPDGEMGGFPAYTFNYRGEPGVRYRGVMAQEVMQKRPDLVHTMPNGYLAVDYAGLEAG